MSFGAPEGIATIPEDIVTFDRTRVFTFTGLVRLETPVNSGPSMFLISQTGFAFTRWGDTHVYSMFNPPPGTITYAGEHHLVWCSGIGAGVRLNFRHPWPSLEGSLQAFALTGGEFSSVTSLRVSIFY